TLTESSTSVDESLALPPALLATEGGLSLALSSSLRRGVDEAELALGSRSFEGAETLASRALFAGAQLAFGAENAPPRSKQLAAERARALESLAALQHYDGGFLAWPGMSASDPFASIHSLHALSRARTSGPESHALARGRTYLQQVLPGQLVE